MIEKYDIPTTATLLSVAESCSAAGLCKVASLETRVPNIAPEILEYKRNNPCPEGFMDLLIDGVSAFEHYGPNRNGDAFTKAALTHVPAGWDQVPADSRKFVAVDYLNNPVNYGEQRAYGYTTFYGGHTFAHHANHDPKNSIGDIAYVHYNDKMGRVEVVSRLSIAKAKDLGDSVLLNAILTGKPIDTSMGAKVNYDECSICHNHARTRADYCIHVLKHAHGGNPGMMRRTSDGRLAFVFNPFPRFFDMSLVLIGADRSSRVIMDLSKVASLDRGKEAELKKATIAKQIRPTPGMSDVINLGDNERDIPEEVLDMGVKSEGIDNMLGNLKSMGIVLKPKEFTRVVLIHKGLPAMADRISSSGNCFAPSSSVTPMHIPMARHRVLRRLLGPYMEDRSMLPPMLSRRLLRFSIMNNKEQPAMQALHLPIMDKISSMYNGYRQDMALSGPFIIKEAYKTDGLVSEIDKFAADTSLTNSLAAAAIAVPLVYLYSAYLNDKKHNKGEDLDVLENIVADHPSLTSVLAMSVGGGVARTV